MELSEKIMQIKAELSHLILKEWLEQDFLSWKWWLLFASLVACYVVWVKLVDKSRIMEIILFGSFIAVMNVTIDIVAV